MKNNYHTHTWRCKHAKGTDEEYILAAIEGGFSAIGFSDHGPFPYGDGYSSPVRMELSQLEEYFESLTALKAKYSESIAVHIGFEYEYLPPYMDFIREMSTHPLVEYLILGSHREEDDRTGSYFGNAATEPEILRYEKNTLQGMNSGVYTYLAHPDLFLCSYPVFDRAAEQVSRHICREAKALSMPLEYNLYGVLKIRDGVKGIGYPSQSFWEIAADEGCTAIIGVDAHFPGMLSDLSLYSEAQQVLDGLRIRME